MRFGTRESVCTSDGRDKVPLGARSQPQAVWRDAGMHGRASGPQGGHAAARITLLRGAGWGTAPHRRDGEDVRDLVDQMVLSRRNPPAVPTSRPRTRRGRQSRRITAPSRRARSTEMVVSAHLQQLVLSPWRRDALASVDHGVNQNLIPARTSSREPTGRAPDRGSGSVRPS